MVNRTRFVFWFPVVGLFILFVVLFIPELIGCSLWLTYTDRMNLLLSVAIALFAAIEGYSTYMQAEMQDKRNLIDDSRNELEKAYGPLYSLLNSNTDEILQKVVLLDNDKKYLDSIFATYPFMFPSEIYDTWRNRIQNIDCEGTTRKVIGIKGNQSEAKFSRYYYLPVEFKRMLNLEL